MLFSRPHTSPESSKSASNTMLMKRCRLLSLLLLETDIKQDEVLRLNKEESLTDILSFTSSEKGLR